MNMICLRPKAGRRLVAAVSGGFLVGLAFLTSGSAQSIGGLCNGSPATHTWLDASGQYGPALIDGTDHADTIIGSDGDDTIDAHDGNDTVAGGPGADNLYGGSGDDVLIDRYEVVERDRFKAGAGFDVCLFGPRDQLTSCEY
jgi:Ca2+-binding RTX toxin-like protein